MFLLPLFRSAFLQTQPSPRELVASMSGFAKEQLPSDGSSNWSLHAKAFLVVCSHRMWRGGPRSILQIAAAAFGLLMLFYFVTLQLDDRYQQILSWSTPESGGSGDLRIVVFGSQDLMGSAPDAKHTHTSWPEHLCKQVRGRTNHYIHLHRLVYANTYSQQC